MDVTKEYPDVLQNIEFTITGIYQQHSELADHNVDKVLSDLIRIYQAEIKSKKPPTLRFTELEQTLYNSVKAICDWRLGRKQALDEQNKAIQIPVQELSLEIMIACLKRICRSVSFWTKEGGRQGYLDYIQNFIR